MVVNKESLKLLYENKLFDGISKIFLKSFLKRKNFIKVTDGEIMYNGDEETSEMFLIVEGKVKIKYSKDRTIEYKNLFDFFGETEILTKSKRNSFAVANSECVLYKISIAELNLLSKSEKTFNDNLFKKDGDEISKPQESVTPDAGTFVDPGNNKKKSDILDFDQMQEEEIFETLSEAELDTIVEPQKSIVKLDDAFKETESNCDEKLKNDLFK